MCIQSPPLNYCSQFQIPSLKELENCRLYQVSIHFTIQANTNKIQLSDSGVFLLLSFIGDKDLGWLDFLFFCYYLLFSRLSYFSSALSDEQWHVALRTNPPFDVQHHCPLNFYYIANFVLFYHGINQFVWFNGLVRFGMKCSCWEISCIFFFSLKRKSVRSFPIKLD